MYKKNLIKVIFVLITSLCFMAGCGKSDALKLSDLVKIDITQNVNFKIANTKDDKKAVLKHIDDKKIIKEFITDTEKIELEPATEGNNFTPYFSVHITSTSSENNNYIIAFCNKGQDILLNNKIYHVSKGSINLEKYYECAQ